MSWKQWLKGMGFMFEFQSLSQESADLAHIAAMTVGVGVLIILMLPSFLSASPVKAGNPRWRRNRIRQRQPLQLA